MELVKESDALNSQSTILIEKMTRIELELTRLKRENSVLRESRVTSHETVDIPQPMIRRLLQLVHPDKHSGSDAANEVTQWLIGLMK